MPSIILILASILAGIVIYGSFVLVFLATPLGLGMIALWFLHRVRREQVLQELQKLPLSPGLTCWLFGAALLTALFVDLFAAYSLLQLVT